MRQLVQDYRTGTVRLVDVPTPVVRPGGVLVRTAASLVSSGTERSKVALARESLIAKARKRPEAVGQVIAAARTEGLAGAKRRVEHKLDQLSPLGYSAAGTVVEVGAGVTRFRAGDSVAVGGGGYANHAEVLWVPHNLVARMPPGVPFEQAAFSTVASISLHAVRLGRPGLGETVGVIGLGLVGQLAAQLAIAAGCRVVGCDLDPHRCDLLRSVGGEATDPERFEARIGTVSGGVGADVVLVAAASAASEPMTLAIGAARDRGRIVAVGAVGMDLPREALFKKEVSIVVSRSYGPGRYDPSYEEAGIDYPVSYVRWTEGRNLDAVLDLIARGKLDLEPLISSRCVLTDAPAMYERLVEGDPSVVGVILEYPDHEASPELSEPPNPTHHTRARIGAEPRIGLIGAGTFASNVLVPELRAAGARMEVVSSASGLSAEDAVRRHGFARSAGTAVDVVEDPEVDVVVIATPHNLHADLAIQAIANRKAVFVEKPLAIHDEELERLEAAVSADAPLFVGFNRRFSPHAVRMIEWLAGRGSAAMLGMRVNAGAIPAESWIHDPTIGGGRLVGEACHFVDLANAFLGPFPMGVRCVGTGGRDPATTLMDNFVIVLEYDDGSIASITYTSKGSNRLGKEAIEIFCDGSSAVIDNWNRVTLHGPNRTRSHRSRSAKGHREEVRAFLAAVRNGTPMPIPVPELLATTRATLAARTSQLAGGARQPLRP
jgi:predicted dehydrogenase/NADPH:quinone reductase-like Zn-dependent oxidoreductase